MEKEKRKRFLHMRKYVFAAAAAGTVFLAPVMDVNAEGEKTESLYLATWYNSVPELPA